MRHRGVLPFAIALAFLMLAGALPGLNGWTGPGRARPEAGIQPPAAPEPRQPPPDATRSGAAEAIHKARTEYEKAILAVDDAFVIAYNRGDSKALVALFAEDAEAVEADGERYQGRERIERRFAETFAASPGVKISLAIDAIRLLHPEVAKEEGRTVIKPSKGLPLNRPYTAIFVKRDGRWRISSIREESDPFVNAHDRLKELEWMIGAWIDEGPDSVVRLDCRWSEEQNFLLRSFIVKLRGRPVMTVSQRIGWDPMARQIRSWDFDSDGSFGEGRWSRIGERWVIKHTGVLPEGTPTSATNIMSRERSDLIRWSTTDRVLGEESIPGDEVFVLVRVPPSPRAQSKGPATPIPSPNTTRSPR